MYVHSHFPLTFSFGDHYEWNKVTSCIHNILSGQRWIEHYGEISIKTTTVKNASARSPSSRSAASAFCPFWEKNTFWNVSFFDILKVSLHKCIVPDVIVIQTTFHHLTSFTRVGHTWPKTYQSTLPGLSESATFLSI